jgi:ABC-2 type transport system ATP-binding protein
MENIVKLDHVCKKYRKRNNYAVEDISLSLQSGEILGILGPNGAGKSTLIKMILGVIMPSAGSLTVFDKAPAHLQNKDKNKLGVLLGGKSNLIFHLPVSDSLQLIRTMYKIPKDIFEERICRYADMLKCEEILNKRVATLSLGQKLKAELLCLLCYEPQLFI